ncbi:G2/mitotic-specific cyclin CLB2 [Spathaspora sp. JA1]|nr:G2/mitotic-specific cyclin CLB2 [Spathaspora sp. JA1]
MAQTTINNENDFRITRSNKQLLQQQQQQQQQQQDQEKQSVFVKPVVSSDKPSSSDSTNELASTTTTRQYLGDVSNQYITTKQNQTNIPPPPKTTQLKKRKPFILPEQQPKKEIPIASDSLIVPARLPQKRQATESSTNLVEQLKVPPISSQAIAATSNLNKKTRLIDYEWQDLDEEDLDDPLMASEYVNEIFKYFYELEQRMLPDPQYLFQQKHLKPKMRSILVDWLVEMHVKFRLLPESLYLAINIMDRFMSIEVVQIDKLQLLATGSLFIAAKYEEVFSPSVKNYAYFTDGSYTEEEILQAEKYILTILNFDLNYPNPMNFLRRISKADDYDVQSRTLGKYLLEITIIDYKFIGMTPSLCCASAMYLARLILGKTPVWNGNLIHYSGGYRLSDMRTCIDLIFQYLIGPIEHDEFYKKYSARKFMKASLLCRSWAKKFHSEGKTLLDEKTSTHRLTLT